MSASAQAYPSADRLGDSAGGWDYIIIGAGHNGLVCANYLARAGARVLLLERRHLIGGAAVSEELKPGYIFSRFSYVFSIFRQKIVDEIFPHNWREELKLYKTNPAMFAPTPTPGKYILITDDERETHDNLAKYASEKDAKNYFEFGRRLKEVGELVSLLIDREPVGSLMDCLKLLPKVRRPKLQSLSEVANFLTSPAAPILDQWFDNDHLKASLSYPGTVGHMMSPYTTGSSLLLLHHVSSTLEEGGKKYRFYPRGGMGAVSEYLGRLAVANGCELYVNAAVDEILVENNQAVGVRLENGTELKAKSVISNCSYHVTFEKMMHRAHVELPDDFTRGLKNISYATNCSKLNMIIRDVPKFTCLEGVFNPSDTFADRKEKAGKFMANTLLPGTSLDDLHQKYLGALGGSFSEEPTIQLLMPSLLDDSLTPPGSEDLVVLMFVQYTPYRLKNGGWDKSAREKFTRNVLNLMDRYAPGFSQSVKFTDLVAPPDIEKLVNLTGGNIFQGALNLNAMYHSRPMPNYSRYETPVGNLYSCSAANHPGGGVSGAPGRNCAMHILKHR